jgi:ceramide glucosyltransferase
VLTAFYILIVLQVLQGLYSLWDGVRWLRMVQRRLGTHSGFYAPRVAVVCPCKGMEPGLAENLAALTHFDYPDYEIFFALASGLDPARKVVDRVAAESPQPAHVVIAGPPKDCGEKANNLSAAAQKVGPEFETIVFTDSDVQLGRAWLRRLVAPLADSRLGAATTFRWLLPSRKFGTASFASAFASAWNAAIVTMLGEHTRNFCWGGGTAIRREVLEEVHAVELWRSVVSEDLALTRLLEEAGRPILFVPECLAPTFFDTTPDGLMEFTNRQMVLTRVYAPRFWAVGGIAHVSYSVTLLYAAWLMLVRAITGETWFELVPLTLLVPLLAAIKGAVRAVAAERLLPEWKEKVKEWTWAWILLAPLVPFLYAWNSIVAAFTRRIRWRGIRYELVSPSQTRILTRGGTRL